MSTERLKHALHFISCSYFTYYKITLSCFFSFPYFLIYFYFTSFHPNSNAFNEEYFSHSTHSFKGELLLLSTVCFVESFVCHRRIFASIFAYSPKDLLHWVYWFEFIKLEMLYEVLLCFDWNENEEWYDWIWNTLHHLFELGMSYLWRITFADWNFIVCIEVTLIEKLCGMLSLILHVPTYTILNDSNGTLQKIY